MQEKPPHVMLSKRAAKTVQQGCPWVYRSDIAWTTALEQTAPGSLVTLCDASGKPLAPAYINPNNTLACRTLPFAADRYPTEENFRWLLNKALAKREKLFLHPYYRLIHAEGDSLPGLVIDRFGDALVCQVATAGMEVLKPRWLPALRSLLHPSAILFRNDLPAREKEGLPLEVTVEGALPTMPVDVPEHDVIYLADLIEGQKTGWFYDQRANRRTAASYAKDKRVLDLYAHSGGFGIAAAKAGAISVTMADVSSFALDLAKRAAERNGVSGACTFLQVDIFDWLPQAEPKQYGLVIADPPAFIKSRQYIANGLRGYRKLAALAAMQVAEGGNFFIASCSHHAHERAFRSAVEEGMRDANRSFTHIHKAGADKDHPVHPRLPENAYLKFLGYRLD